jgi:hypothetical protein
MVSHRRPIRNFLKKKVTVGQGKTLKGWRICLNFNLREKSVLKTPSCLLRLDIKSRFTEWYAKPV